MKGRRVGGKVIKLTSFQPIRRGNWLMQFSFTSMNSIMLTASSATNPTNTFIRFFSDEEEAVSFIDFLAEQDEYKIEH